MQASSVGSSSHSSGRDSWQNVSACFALAESYGSPRGNGDVSLPPLRLLVSLPWALTPCTRQDAASLQLGVITLLPLCFLGFCVMLLSRRFIIKPMSLITRPALLHMKVLCTITICFSC